MFKEKTVLFSTFIYVYDCFKQVMQVVRDKKAP